MNAIYTECKELPNSIKSALRSVGYNRNDISIEAREEMSLASPPAFEGSRGFTCVIDLASGQHRIEHGSWGGRNPFEHHAVDCDENLYPMKAGVAILQGESGGRGCFAHLYLHPDNMCKFLPAVPTLTATKARKVVSTLPRRLARVLEKLHIECEWGDEWVACNDCGKLLRTQPDSMWWKPSFYCDENGAHCRIAHNMFGFVGCNHT